MKKRARSSALKQLREEADIYFDKLFEEIREYEKVGSITIRDDVRLSTAAHEAAHLLRVAMKTEQESE